MIAVIFCLGLLGAGSAPAQDSCIDYAQYPDLVGTEWVSGIASGLRASGDHLYVACNPYGLRVIDITDPAAPFRVGFFNTPGQARELVVVGDLVYLADGTQGLQIISVSDPTSPLPVGSIDTQGQTNSIQVVGDLAYMGSGLSTGGLIIIDVSDPENPSQLSITPVAGDVRDIAVAGSHVFVADYGGFVYVFDVSDPSAPVQATLFETADAPLDLAVEDSVLAVAAYHAGVQLFDITDPVNPHFTGSFQTRTTYQSYVFDVVLDGSRGYCATNDDVVVVFDLSDPWAPFELAALPTGGDIASVALAPGLVLAALGENGVQVIQDNGFDLPEPVGKLSAQQNFAPGPFGIITRANSNYAVVASSQLVTVHLDPPTFPLLAGTATAGEDNYDIAVKSHYAYVMKDPYNQIWAYDLSDPWAPERVGIHQTLGNSPDRLVAHGDYLYSAPHNNNLGVWDISDPHWPGLVGYVAGGPQISAMGAQGDRLYLGHYETVVVLDLTHPAGPVIIDSLDVEGRILGITVAGRYLYLASHFHGVDILDLEQPDTPVVGHFPVERVQHVTVHEGIGYFSDYLAGIYVVDLTDVTDPQLLGIKRGGCIATAVDGDHLIASGSGYLGGIEILPLQCGGVSAVEDGPDIPDIQGLAISAAPNPFNPQTRISLVLETDGPVNLAVYDVAGRKVRQLISGKWLAHGQHELNWNGRDDQGRQLPSGAYFLLIRADGKEKTETVTLLK
jgi:hypothetical protein